MSIVEGFIGSLNWTVTSVSGETSVAFGAGVRLAIVGGVVSLPEPSVTIPRRMGETVVVDVDSAARYWM